MKRNGQITAFYFETLLLIVVFLSIILVLTQVFGMTRQQSAAARQLTDAVTLAGNAAEAVSASADPAELLKLLNENGNAEELPDASGVKAFYDNEKNPDPQGAYCVQVSWQPEKTARGTMVSSVIQVCHGSSEEPIYSLETASFREEGAP
jgi:hypothetical protein